MPVPRRKALPIVALVGRANVGKSTLWNKLTETGKAIVSDTPHTTRDRNYAPVIWRATSFECVDTGGMDAEQGSEMGRGILRQAELAIKEADLVLFLVDTKAGASALDQDLARHVKKLNKHVVPVANKLDDMKFLGDAYSQELMGLELGEPIPCSASTGRGVGDLLERIHEELIKVGKPPVPVEDDAGLKIAVIGRPNVGKSSLVNAILGEERVISSPTAHTTREPIDTQFDWNGNRITLIDTAGMRKQSRVDKGIEEMSVERNGGAIARADIAFLVVDATEPASSQDKHLAGILKEETKGLILVANKWDLVDDKDTHTSEEYEREIRRAFPFLSFAPIMFISAKNRQRTDKLLELAFKVREERRRVITHNALQRLLKTVVARKKPLPDIGNYSPYLHDVSQVGIEPPKFLITVRGEKASVHESWIRYFENRLREKFDFTGTPIVIKVEMLPIRLIPQEARINSDGTKRKPRRKRPIGRKGTRY